MTEPSNREAKRQRIGRMVAGLPATVFDKLTPELQFEARKSDALERANPRMPTTFFGCVVWSLKTHEEVVMLAISLRNLYTNGRGIGK